MSKQTDILRHKDDGMERQADECRDGQTDELRDGWRERRVMKVHLIEKDRIGRYL